MPYLIAMGTDPEPTMKNKADQQLVEIDKKYSGFIHVSGVIVCDDQKRCESETSVATAAQHLI